MNKLLAEDVFKPGAFPKYTYISRKSEELDTNFELRLKFSLKLAGYLTSIVGPSKIGKTVLCEKVIGLDNIKEITGADFNNELDFWSIVGAKAGLPMQGQFAETNNLEGVNEIKGINKTETYLLTKDRVIKHFKENGYVLVLDDFHYAKEEIQVHIAQQLKDAIRKEFKVIIISLPHRADDTIRKNTDLMGRLNLMNIEPWRLVELEEIARKGFGELGIRIDEDLIEKIAIESLTSPQLMQSICLSICTLLDSDSNEIKEIPEDILKKSYKFTTMNFEYKDVINILKSGPNTRGKKRKLFQTYNNKTLDIYGLIVEAIAENPPNMSISLDDLKARIDKLLDNVEKKTDKQTIRDSVNKLQIIMNEKENIYRVFEWKDNTIHILDPLFLFFLRWGTY